MFVEMQALLVWADKGCHTSGFLRRQAPCLAEALRCTPGLGSAQRQECDQSGLGSWGGTHLFSLPYTLALLFQSGLHQSKVSSRGECISPRLHRTCTAGSGIETTFGSRAEPTRNGSDTRGHRWSQPVTGR